MADNFDVVSKSKPEISVVIGTYNRCRFLKKTIESVRQELKGCHCEIIVVDGGSDDGTLNWLVKQKDIISIVQHNRGTWNGQKIHRRSWGYFMNLGFRSTQSDFVCMLSDDCLVVPGAITNGLNFLTDKLDSGEKVGAVAFYWKNWPQQTKYNVGTTLGDKLFVNHGIYSKTALEDVGYIDEDNYQFYCADGDLCLKMWEKGYICLAVENSYIEHFTHANISVRTSNFSSYDKDLETYLKRWEGVFYDPLKNNVGGWIEQEYENSNSTAEKFIECLTFFKKIRYFMSKN